MTDSEMRRVYTRRGTRREADADQKKTGLSGRRSIVRRDHKAVMETQHGGKQDGKNRKEGW